LHPIVACMIRLYASLGGRYTVPTYFTIAAPLSVCHRL